MWGPGIIARRCRQDRQRLPAGLGSLARSVTHPNREVEELPNATLKLRSRDLKCRVLKVKADGDFGPLGHNVRMEVYQTNELPGGIARIDMQSTLKGRKVTIHAHAVEYNALSVSEATQAAATDRQTQTVGD